MPSVYRISTGEKILLVGEGNFSFSKDFVILNELSCSNKSDIVSTCKESEFTSNIEIKEDTIKFLYEKGVTVVFNVDATKLKCHPSLKNRKFDKIIFNFPHVGGKMKIHLNRKLLKDFFSSAGDVLEENGSVVVALCDGQGGTEADKKVRRWDDTWQVTEMAALSDFILHAVEPFDASCFPHYVNVGFRSCDKSFYSENAVVHVFKKQILPRILLENPTEWFSVEDLGEDLIFDFLDKHMVNPFSNPNSATSYLFECLKNKLCSHFHVFKSIVKYHRSFVPYQESRTNCDVSYLTEPTHTGILDIYATVKQTVSNTDNIVVKVLMNCKPVVLKDFSSPPVRCQMVLFGTEVSSLLLFEYITQMLKSADSEWKADIIETNNEPCISRIVISSSNSYPNQNVTITEGFVLPDGMPCHMIHLDELAQVLFKLRDWQSLWGGSVDSSLDNPIFCPTSLFPRAYSFDLGLSIPLNFKEQFEEKFFLLLWILAGDLIVKTEHLTTYLPPDRDLICYCYRITYRSHTVPLHRKRVIHIHEKIIAPFICRLLKINIT